MSALFCDLVGFTSLSELRDPEEVRELLSGFFDSCRSIIESYGGTVEKFIGDAVMAVWGTPVANEDDAERAVRAALDVVEAVAALGQRVNAPELRARAGVLTGEAVVNLGASGQGMVAGDVVNTASRLQSLAERGTVLVGEATYQAASPAIAFAALGELQLKGKEERVPAWRALRVVGQRRGQGVIRGLEPPFTGRAPEFRRLKDLLQSTAEERRAQLVSVTGIPGIGKSRLAWELLKYVDGVAETIYWHQGNCPAYGDGISFWALAEMVRMRAGITDSEDPPSARVKLEESVAQFISDPEEVRWVQPRLAHLLGLAEAPPGGREELFSAWRTFFERIAEQGPTVMVFEDLQWADPGLIDFVESILEWCRSQPIMVVTLSRPELMEKRPTWGAHQPNFLSIHLGPLADEAMRELLQGLVRGLPEAVAKRLLERAEGVPLYAVETVRMLVVRGVLVEHDGAYEVAGDLSKLEVPGTLHALIASRLDALPPEQRALVQDAAVLGKNFSAPALAAVTGIDPGVLEGQLRDLVRKELLVLDTDPRSPQRGQYGFVQGLIQEVAYGVIARRDRLAKHLAAAHYFESVEDEELAGVVAAHYLEAHRASPADAEAEVVAAQARTWLDRAGQRALRLGSPELALRYFEHALEVVAAPADRAELLIQAGAAAGRASLNEQAVTCLEEAIAYYTGSGDPAAAGLATAELVRTLVRVLRFPEAIERAERAFEAVGTARGDLARAELAGELARAHGASGSPAASLRWSETGLALAAQLDDTELLGRCLGARASALFELGRHREAAVLARGCVQLAEESGTLLEQADAHRLVSLVVLDDSLREGLTTSLRTAELARRGGDRAMERTALLNATESAIDLGEWAEAARVLTEPSQTEGIEADFLVICRALLTAYTSDPRQAMELLEPLASRLTTSPYVSSNTTYLRARAVVRWLEGDLEAAYRDAAAGVAADPQGFNSPAALAVQARAALWLRDPERARGALAGMKGFRGRWAAAQRLTVEVGLAALEAPAEEAAELCRQASEVWEALDAPLDRALCWLDLAVLLGPHPAAARAQAEARELLVRLGAQPLMDRLNQALAHTARPT